VRDPLGSEGRGRRKFFWYVAKLGAGESWVAPARSHSPCSHAGNISALALAATDSGRDNAVTINCGLIGTGHATTCLPDMGGFACKR
jgi:hypothetical protein